MTIFSEGEAMDPPEGKRGSGRSLNPQRGEIQPGRKGKKSTSSMDSKGEYEHCGEGGRGIHEKRN